MFIDCVFKMDAPVESSDQACLSAVSWSSDWAAAIQNIGRVCAKFAIAVALISEVSDTGF
jgi:hypothetical protein